MGRRHSKYIVITALMLAILVPFYFVLDSATTDVVELSQNSRPVIDDLGLIRSSDKLSTGAQKKNKIRFDAAPDVPKPKFVPYPTKAKPGAPWLNYSKEHHKNVTRESNGSEGDTGVVIQTDDHTLVHNRSYSKPSQLNDTNKTPVIVIPSTTQTTPKPTAAVTAKQPVRPQREESHVREKQKLLIIGGIVLDSNDEAQPTSLPGNRYKGEGGAANEKNGNNDPEKIDKNTPDDKDNKKEAPSLTSQPQADEVGDSKQKAEAEDWRMLLATNNRKVNTAGTPVRQNVVNYAKLSNTTSKYNWREFFDNPVEVLENNMHVNVSVGIKLPVMKYVYPTKAKPEAPAGVDFYRRRGDNSKPEHFINGAEPEIAHKKTKTTPNPLDIFDKQVTMKHLEAWGRRNQETLEGENIVSMTLYGSNPRYTMGAIRNAELVRENFPGWKLRVYTETPSENPRYGAVPNTVLTSLRNLGAQIYFMQPGEDFIPPMMWRFLVADDLWVSRFIVRDSDARLTERDAAAVNAWVKSDKPFNCIRDHPSHAAYAISGGMWGGKPTQMRNVLRRSWRDLMRGVRSDYLQDMNFLNYVIWPKMQNMAYCSDSVSCENWPGAHPFPVPRYGYEHVGQVVNEQDLGRPIDIQILRKAGENEKCSPKDNPILVKQD